MRLDHIAYRVKNRHATTKFFIEAFGYKIQQEFTLDFGKNRYAQCVALEPPERQTNMPWMWEGWQIPPVGENVDLTATTKYHMAPEIFISDGNEGSIVGDWVAARGGVGGIHHLAYQVESVEKIMEEWRQKGYAEFTSNTPMQCPGLKQVFTKPSELTGVIYEFIERSEFGFCKENVKDLMISTKDF